MNNLRRALAEATAPPADSLAAAEARALDLQGAHDATLAERAQFQARIDDLHHALAEATARLPTASPPPRPAPRPPEAPRHNLSLK